MAAANELKIRIILNDNDFLELNKEQLILKWKLQDKYIDILEEKFKNLENINYEKKLKDLEDTKNLEIAKLKNLLLMKYVIREQDNQVIKKFLNFFKKKLIISIL